MRWLRGGLALILLALTACNGQPPPAATSAPAPAFTPTPTPFQPSAWLVTPTPVPAVTPSAPTQPPDRSPVLWLDDRLPPDLYALGQGLAAQTVPVAEAADVQFTLLPPEAEGSRWVYALVAPFSTLTDEISAAQLREWWTEGSGGRLLYVSESGLGFSERWGPPAAAVRTLGDEAAVLEAVRRGDGWGLVSFTALEPDVKVIRVDGRSPLDKEFAAADWPLTLTYGFIPQPPADWAAALPPSNRNADHLTVLVMTGVTALVRATADRMEKKGVLYPGRDVRDWLRSADITHISNEIPFYDRCPPPNPYQTNVVFCSDPRYLALLEDVGTDVVELTGNHFQDYGTEATLQTLALYEREGWPYFGGGRNVDEARQPALVEHNGNRLAFIGCNEPGPTFAWAAASRPGAAPCGDMTWMLEKVRALKEEGYLVIATFQYVEYYTHQAPPNQVADFGAVADAGADIVSGSQAHFPQGMAWEEGRFIHYGLGNLFFDQMDIPVVGTRRAFIDRYTIYEGRLIGVELLTTMLEDYARPRPMTTAERQALLRDVFTASGWPVYP